MLHCKIKMHILAKVLSLPFLKESGFIKYLFIYLLKGVSIYKVFAYLSSPANQSIQLLVKCKLEIEGV